MVNFCQTYLPFCSSPFRGAFLGGLEGETISEMPCRAVKKYQFYGQSTSKCNLVIQVNGKKKFVISVDTNLNQDEFLKELDKQTGL